MSILLGIVGDKHKNKAKAEHGQRGKSKKRGAPSEKIDEKTAGRNAHKGSGRPADFEDAHGKPPPVERDALSNIGLDGRIEQIFGKAAQKHGRHQGIIERHSAGQKHSRCQQKKSCEHHLFVAASVSDVGGKKPQHGGGLIDGNHRGDGGQRNAKPSADDAGKGVDKAVGGVDHPTG